MNKTAKARRGKKPAVSVRFASKVERELVKKAARLDGVSVNVFMRRAVLDLSRSKLQAVPPFEGEKTA